VTERKGIQGVRRQVGLGLRPTLSMDIMPVRSDIFGTAGCYILRGNTYYPYTLPTPIALRGGDMVSAIEYPTALCNTCTIEVGVEETAKLSLEYFVIDAALRTPGAYWAGPWTTYGSEPALFEWYQSAVQINSGAGNYNCYAQRAKVSISNNLKWEFNLDFGKTAGSLRRADEVFPGDETVEVEIEILDFPSFDMWDDALVGDLTHTTFSAEVGMYNGFETITVMLNNLEIQEFSNPWQASDDLLVRTIKARSPGNIRQADGFHTFPNIAIAVS
jgi:hypothetical protein